MGGRTVGVDIGSRTVTLAEVARRRGTPTITNFGGVELPAGAVREGEILDVAAVAAALKDLVAAAKVRERRVRLGVANQRVVVRQIELPWMPAGELRSSLPFLVQDHLPIPVDDAEMDVHVLGEILDDDGARRLRVVLVAAHHDTVAAHVDAARKAGLKPVAVDLNPFATLRSVGTTSAVGDTCEAVIDIGAGVTDVIVHDGGVPSFVRILGSGGEDLTHAIAEQASTSAEDAERRKRATATGDADPATCRIVEQRSSAFVEEIRSTLDYHQAHGGSPLHSIVLTGGGGCLQGLADRLAGALHLPVDVVNVFDRWKVGRSAYAPEQLRDVAPALTVAVGLALGGAA